MKRPSEFQIRLILVASVVVVAVWYNYRQQKDQLEQYRVEPLRTLGGPALTRQFPYGHEVYGTVLHQEPATMRWHRLVVETADKDIVECVVPEAYQVKVGERVRRFEIAVPTSEVLHSPDLQGYNLPVCEPYPLRIP